MFHKLWQLFFILCALSLYADAMKPSSSTLAAKKGTKQLDNKMKKQQRQLTPLTPSRKRTLAPITDEQIGHLLGVDDSERSKKSRNAFANAANMKKAVPKTAQMVVDSVEQNVEQPVKSNVEPTGVETNMPASNAETKEPKKQQEELVEMSDTLIWEMAVRSDKVQINDPEGDLEWFLELIFNKLDQFLNVMPEMDGQQKGQLAQLLVDSRRRMDDANQQQIIPMNNEIGLVKQVEHSLDSFGNQLRESVMHNLKVSPAHFDILLFDYLDQKIHKKEKGDFLWKVVNRKVTRYVKNVGQFFGGVQIAIKYLQQSEQIVQWAEKNSFITAEQSKNLNAIVKQSVSDLVALERGMATKLGVDLEKIGMPTLMAQTFPSLDNYLTNNLQKTFNQSKVIGQQENKNAAQMGTALLVTALTVASAEVGRLKAEILGIQLTWDTFQAVGEVSKMADLLKHVDL